MTEAEIDIGLEPLQKSQTLSLQGIGYDEKALQLFFYDGAGSLTFTFSMKPGTPFFFVSSEKIRRIKNLKKPLSLFLKIHFMNQDLVEVKRLESLGRVFEFRFDDRCLKLSLIPGLINVTAQVGDKEVHALKPKDIPEKSAATYPSDGSSRTSEDFQAFWQKKHQANAKSSSGEKSQQQKDLKKKTRGLEKMLEKREELKNSLYQSAGRWLTENQTIDGVPEQYARLIDPSQSLAWNIENCFEKDKKNKSKIAGTDDRIATLKKEIERLESVNIVQAPKPQSQSLLKVAEVKGRTYDVQGHKLYLGKSGKDNLKILRQAKPWFHWFHIKDYPGTHGILECQKKEKLSLPLLKEAAQVVLKQSVPKGASGAFDVLVTECRYVRPVKGAKAGQVTHSNSQVLRVKYEP